MYPLNSMADVREVLNVMIISDKILVLVHWCKASLVRKVTYEHGLHSVRVRFPYMLRGFSTHLTRALTPLNTVSFAWTIRNFDSTESRSFHIPGLCYVGSSIW